MVDSWIATSIHVCKSLALPILRKNNQACMCVQVYWVEQMDMVLTVMINENLGFTQGT